MESTDTNTCNTLQPSFLPKEEHFISPPVFRTTFFSYVGTQGFLSVVTRLQNLPRNVGGSLLWWPRFDPAQEVAAKKSDPLMLCHNGEVRPPLPLLQSKQICSSRPKNTSSLTINQKTCVYAFALTSEKSALNGTASLRQVSDEQPQLPSRQMPSPWPPTRATQHTTNIAHLENILKTLPPRKEAHRAPE